MHTFNPPAPTGWPPAHSETREACALLCHTPSHSRRTHTRSRVRTPHTHVVVPGCRWNCLPLLLLLLSPPLLPFEISCTVERDHGSANHNLRASGKFNFSSETSYTTCASRDSEQEHRGDRARNFCNQMNGMVVLFSPAFDVRVSGLVQPASQQSLYYLCCSCS